MNKTGIIIFILSVCTSVLAQKDPAWDNTADKKWKDEFEKVDIPSTADGTIQKAFIYRSKSKTPKPLIVSLHTWSGDYSQRDPISDEILARDWNYIHPDFRGPNNTPDAMGSPLVISDIEDAVRYALEHTGANPDEVHIMGVSGGGFATLVAYMNIQYPVKSFSAWAPISDIEAWYWESTGRKQKYATDIVHAVSTDQTFNRGEALRRSPLMQAFPKEKRKNSKLYIYEGIHDGYTGSVPITHSINMYNRLVGDLKYGLSGQDDILRKADADSALVSAKEIIDLVTKRINPEYNKDDVLYGRNIYLSREYGNIRLTVFEGGHEQLPQALALVPYRESTSLKYNIFTLGDSNGQNKGGWVDQLRKMMPDSHIVNISRGGRTIGFDNNGDKNLNALRNIDLFLDDARKQIGGKHYDYIIVCLGTNDTKSEFSERQKEVVDNFGKLLDRIKSHKLTRKSKPRLVFVTPPPIRPDNIESKYQGGNDRLAKLVPELGDIARQKGFTVIDVYHPLLGILDYYAADGVHMAAPGQEIIASKIVDMIGSN